MPTPPRKKKNNASRGQKKAETDATPTPPQDLPDADTVITEVPFTSPKGNTYRIIVTNQTDEYDPPVVAEPPPKKAPAKPRRKKPAEKSENRS